MSLIRKDWNVVAELNAGHFETGKWHLDRLGGIPGETGHEQVLVAKVPNVDAWLDRLHEKWTVGWAIFDDFSYIRPVRYKFTFRTEGELKERAIDLAGEFAPKLAGRHFSIHIEPRGLDQPEIAARVRSELCERLTERVECSYRDAADRPNIEDAVIDVEVVEQTVGLAVWTRQELEAHPFLGL